MRRRLYLTVALAYGDAVPLEVRPFARERDAQAHCKAVARENDFTIRETRPGFLPCWANDSESISIVTLVF